MTVAIIMAVVGAVGLFAAVALAFQPESNMVYNPVLGRLERYIAADEGEQQELQRETPLHLWVDRVRRRIAERDESQRSGDRRLDALADALSKADLDIAPSEWRIMLGFIGLVLGLLFAWRTNIIIGVLVAVVAPYLGGRFWLRYRQRRRMIRFENQLGDVCMLLSSSLRAGYSFAQAMEAVVSGSRSPTKEEFSRAQRELALGVPIDDALRRLVDRNHSDDLDLTVTAVQIQRVVGGNLAEILDTIAHTIRERVRIKGEIRTLTAQARISGWIISLLPIGLAAVLSVIAPDYINPMFHETIGWFMLGLGGFSMLIGIMAIRRIVDIRV